MYTRSSLDTTGGNLRQTATLNTCTSVKLIEKPIGESVGMMARTCEAGDNVRQAKWTNTDLETQEIVHQDLYS